MGHVGQAPPGANQVVDVHESDHDAFHLLLVGQVGQHSQQVVIALVILDFLVVARVRLQDVAAQRIDLQIFEGIGEGGDGTPQVGTVQVKLLPHPGRETTDP